MSTKFFTNEGSNTLLQKFEGILRHNPLLTEFDILVGYFRSTGFFQLQPHLANLKQVRILVGIDVDQLTAEAQRRGRLFMGASEGLVNDDFSTQFCEEVGASNYDMQTETNIQQFVSDIQSGRIQLRAHPSRKLHAKVYILRPEDFNEHNSGEVITGSSNLSAAGLGSDQAAASYEFNVALRDYEDISFASKEFMRLWDESTPILPEVVEAAKQGTHLRNITPRELYYKLLIEYFGDEIEYDPNILADMPKGYKKLDYQAHAIEQGFRLLQKHNGFFLADVVGLGKTIVAIKIAQKFFFENGYPDYRSRTLVVHPPVLESMWKETIDHFRLDNTECISSGSLHKVSKPNKYDLIIVDEAHKFRNDESESYSQLQSICKSLTLNGTNKRVILVSATPLNNKPEDIKSQLLLFQDSHNSTLEVSIGNYFSQAIKTYKEAIKSDDSESKRKKIEKIYEDIRNKILEPIAVRRTRADLQEYFSDDLSEQGINFPKIGKPKQLFYQLNDELDSLYEETRNIISNNNQSGLTYARYRLTNFLLPEFQAEYKSPLTSGENLAAIMTTLLLKRLDSSFYAFHKTLERFVRQAQIMKKMIEKNEIILKPDIKIQEYIEQERDEELQAYLQATVGSRKYSCENFIAELFVELDRDRYILERLENQWENVVLNQPDPKLEYLVEQLPTTLLSSERNPTGKLIIFSESRDTTKYLEDKLLHLGFRVLGIAAEDRSRYSEIIQRNFDASISRKKQADNYDILISTETLSEGVNLHRSNSVVNYDTPWNSTRLMQRVGRVNRIDGDLEEIFIYNFLPTVQIDDDITLKERAAMKLLAFHKALGTDSQIYTDDEEVGSFGLFDKTIGKEDELDRRLGYVIELRKLRDDNFDEFKRIKDMPLKLRNTVVDQELSNSTLCFLRNSRDGTFRRFYRIQEINQSNSMQQELSFTKCAEIFRGHIDDDTKDLPDFHHRHVCKAQNIYFHQLQEEHKLDYDSVKFSPQERKAINYLSALIKSDVANLDEIVDLKRAKEWISYGRSQNLVREISRYARRQNDIPFTPAVQLRETLGIIEKHIIKTNSGKTYSPQFSSALVSPEIVISQTYLES